MQPRMPRLLFASAVAIVVGACTPFATTQAGKDYTANYNRAVAGEQATDALTLREAYRASRQCGEADYAVREHAGEQLSTVSGPLTMKAASQRCQALTQQLRQKPIQGCGTREFTVFSKIQGDGTWTPPAVLFFSKSEEKSYVPVACPEVPPPPPPPVSEPGFDKVVAALQEKCGPEAQIHIPGEWSLRTNERGVVVRRERTVDCFVKGTRSDWWLEP
ncbi:hypothetical protein [Cystobacter fuscus]|uniref:hypothetical protein n=1 Tax=Cystobacter fuscus TaxID=43 RepID=UPI0012DCCB2B|nr:hypothetical protein [Cystobacter fuscus]